MGAETCVTTISSTSFTCDGVICDTIAVDDLDIEVKVIESESMTSLLTLFVGSNKVHNCDNVPNTGLFTFSSTLAVVFVGEGEGLLKYELRRSREGGEVVLVKSLKAERSK